MNANDKLPSHKLSKSLKKRLLNQFSPLLKGIEKDKWQDDEWFEKWLELAHGDQSNKNS
jgi:hypothetical protein